MRGADYFTRRRDQGPLSPVSERLRFALLFLAVIAGVLLSGTRYNDSVGKAAFLAVGTWLCVYGAVDLVWLATGDVERVWTKTKSQSVAVAVVLALGPGADRLLRLADSINSGHRVTCR